MNHNLRWLLASLAVSVGLLFMAERGDAGPEKGPWQPIVSKDIYQELAKREAEQIREILTGKPDEAAINRAKFGAMFLAALTMSAKDVPAEELRGLRGAAVQLAATLNKKGQLVDAKNLAALLPDKAKPDPNVKETTVNWGSYLQKPDLMDHYRVKSKRGDGMHPDLQSNIRLKGALDGIEEKIRALTMKELNAAGLKKEAKELELLGYRSAVVGSLNYYYAPAKKVGAKDPQEWRTLSLQMRDNCVALAIAAKKSDAGGILKASNTLNSTCSQCHTIFR